MLARFLLRSQWHARRGRQLVVGASLATGLIAILAASMLLQGAEQAMVRPLHDVISGDVRVTQGSPDLAGGSPWPDARPIQEAIRTIPGAVAASRWEASQVTARSDRIENWTGGLLIGIDPTLAAEQDPLRPYLAWGSTLPTVSTADPATHFVYVPLLVGESAARRLDLHPGPGGGANFSEVLTITSGRFPVGSSEPLASKAVVVGVFRSGLEALDRFAVFAPIEDVRFLVGGQRGDSSANALVIHGASLAEIEALHIQGAIAEDAGGVARQVMGLVLVVMDIAAGLAMGVVALLLTLLVAREVSLQVTRDAQTVAALRAIGVPLRSILLSYVGLAVATAAVAALFAAAVALMVAWFAPAVSVHTSGLALDIGWILPWQAVVAAVTSAVFVAALAAWAAAGRLARPTVADALRPR